MRAGRHPRNVSDLERGLSLFGGAALVLYGMKVAQASVCGVLPGLVREVIHCRKTYNTLCV